MIVVAVEGYPDVQAVKNVLAHLRLKDSIVIPKRGKSHLDAALPELNRSARRIRCLVVRDLDNDAPCAGALCQKLLPHPSPNMILRIAVRKIESWLLAD